MSNNMYTYWNEDAIQTDPIEFSVKKDHLTVPEDKRIIRIRTPEPSITVLSAKQVKNDKNLL